ncbi:VOC family protein [Candidatus Thiodiazotropha sp. CDECU1]|uniref:VOC family protein n=1 Tax=Candidatus Thiodiazotropha sp. CDECU1 TaxID=3065865 RepID=UPI0029306EAE|nr:VOC family protein [Candidatus Thiodiazotropha sp. CDECU1]
MFEDPADSLRILVKCSKKCSIVVSIQTKGCLHARQFKSPLGKEIIMADNPVAWFEIYVNEMKRAKRFYESVLAVDLEKLNDPNDSGIEMWSFPSDVQEYGATGALVKMDGFAAGGNSTLVYFSCEDCAVEESRVEAAGGKIHQAKMSIGEYGFISLAIDTEGNMFGLHSMK